MRFPSYSSRGGGRLSMAPVVLFVFSILLASVFVGNVEALHSTDTITSGGDNTRSGYQP